MNLHVLSMLGGRLLVALLTLLIVSFVVFCATQILPGDVAEVLLGQAATPEAVAGLRAAMHLNDPAILRFFRWLGGMLTGDLGISYANNRPITELVAGRLAIPGEQYEAASVDGATRWQKFRFITWPAMRSLYLTSTILSMIWTLGDFNSVYLLTGGGPGDLNHVLATLGIRYMRNNNLDLGIASIIVAMPLILPMVFVMVKRLSKGPDA